MIKIEIMRKIKLLVASFLFCAMSYVGYMGYESATLTEAERLMIANVEALTLNEPGGGGAYSCTVTTQCSALFLNSTISCSGDNYCKRGLDIKGSYVECDGRRTYCMS